MLILCKEKSFPPACTRPSTISNAKNLSNHVYVIALETKINATDEERAIYWNELHKLNSTIRQIHIKRKMK